MKNYLAPVLQVLKNLDELENINKEDSFPLFTNSFVLYFFIKDKEGGTVGFQPRGEWAEAASHLH